MSLTIKLNDMSPVQSCDCQAEPALELKLCHKSASSTPLDHVLIACLLVYLEVYCRQHRVTPLNVQLLLHPNSGQRGEYVGFVV